MFTLNDVVPWGRSFDEYRRMFSLSAADLERGVLGCADGPASFNAEATRRGHRVMSIDPIYRFDRSQIQERIDATCDEVLRQTRLNREAFVWADIPTVDALRDARMGAMREFLDDLDSGASDGRYVAAALPALPFRTGAFDLALCSHFLFLYTDRLGEAFHRAAIAELCRVAGEIRVFPLVTLAGAPSPLVEAVVDTARECGFDASVERVDYEFQRGANQMLRLSSI